MSYLERRARLNHSLSAWRERPQIKPRPLQISDDAHDRSLFSKPLNIIMNQVIGAPETTFVDTNQVVDVEPND